MWLSSVTTLTLEIEDKLATHTTTEKALFLILWLLLHLNTRRTTHALTTTVCQSSFSTLSFLHTHIIHVHNHASSRNERVRKMNINVLQLSVRTTMEIVSFFFSSSLQRVLSESVICGYNRGLLVLSSFYTNFPSFLLASELRFFSSIFIQSLLCVYVSACVLYGDKETTCAERRQISQVFLLGIPALKSWKNRMQCPSSLFPRKNRMQFRRVDSLEI